jgi:hypothetical protein
VKNNTPFDGAVFKKYGYRVCKAAAQYSVTPEAVFKDPANYFLNKDFNPMTTKERMKAVKVGGIEGGLFSSKVFGRRTSTTIPLNKLNKKVLNETISGKADKFLNGLRTEGKRLPGQLVEIKPMTAAEEVIQQLINSGMALEKCGCKANHVVMGDGVKVELIRLLEKDLKDSGAVRDSRVENEIVITKKEGLLLKNTPTALVIGYALGAIITYFVCNWLGW